MHHSRRKSGHGSMTDVRKAASAADKHKSSAKQSSTSISSSSRRTGAGQTSSKTSKSASASASRDAEKARDEEDSWFGDERESFPQFCMTCEKQFVAKDDNFLYCSEECRDYDQQHGATLYAPNSYSSRVSYPEPPPPEPRDIIPRASPSRPSSTYFSLSPSHQATTSSTLPTAASTSSAIAALRSLSLRDASPPSPSGALSAAASFWPFSMRSTTAASPNASPHSATAYATTYDHGYYQTGTPNYYTYNYGADASGASGYAPERPLPPRRPGSYSRTKSIDLVTPLSQ